jgi:rhodanese-related sulfurtransferase/phosphohistidine swiveling domain-containing protein
MRLKYLTTPLLAAALPAYAIPSPDLVINAFASAAQIAGLLAAMSGAALLRVQSAGGGSHPRAKHWLSLFGVVAVLALLVNVWQYASHVSANSRRLETNLWRKPADWDRTFTAPTVTSAELAARMARSEAMHLIDVREPEEFEVTHLPGAINLRYADLLLGVRQPPSDGLPVVFACDSGKRSGEVCEQLTRNGQPCQVLEGGYPQWVREDRPLSTPAYGWRARFTPLPRYARDTIYLDTPEVSDLVQHDKARFLDVRSPDEFARGHLPDALNLPMRGMASDALANALAQLPRQPFVAACYDNRSCFHARVLGLKLTRLGLDFRGRYTVPQEYPVPAQIAARGMWPRVQRVTSTAIDKAVEPLARGLAFASARLGGLVPAMLLLLLLTRLPLAPLAAKAQRDRLALRAIADQTTQLRAHYAGDHFRLHRAVQQLRRQHGLTPWRNLAVSLLQMGVFLVCFAAVRAAAQWSDESFLWLELLREPDATGALALAIGITACALTHRLLVNTDMKQATRWALGALAGGVMVWLSWDLSAAISLYLLASMALLWLQQRPWHVRAARLRQWWRVHRHSVPSLPTQALPLEHCTHASAVGNKALRQGYMRLAGLPVPPGWAWPAHASEPGNATDALAELAALGLDPQARYAVRSSGMAEDSAAQSFAGVFRSELQVPFQDVPAAMQRVRASYSDAARRAPDTAAGYAASTPHRGGVIVQEMVQADYAGVLFTRDPGNVGAMLIEWVAGLGEALASGHATPSALRVGRVSGLPLNSTTPCPLDMAPLIALARQIESLFGRAQDIEWAFAQGNFYILQARDIVEAPHAGDTSTPHHTLIEQERTRLLDLLASNACNPDEAALVQTDMTADLPRPTPLSLSLMQRLRGDGGATDRACERLGLNWNVGPHSTPEVQSAFGQTFVLHAQAVARGPSMGVMASFYLSRSAKAIEANFRDVFLPRHQEAMRWREVMDLQALTEDELVTILQTWVRQFVQDHYVEADVINIAAEFYTRAASQALARKGLAPAQLALAMVQPQATPTLATHGHRAVHDWELSEPRYSEDPATFAQQFGELKVQRAGDAQAAAGDDQATAAVNKHASDQAIDNPPPQVKRKLLHSSVARAQHFAQLKEEAKHALLRELAQIRRLLQVLDQRLALDGLIYHLTLDEVPALLGPTAPVLRQLAQRRREQARVFREVLVGSSLSMRELESRTDWLHAAPPSGSTVPASDVLKGLRVSGHKEVTGPVRVLRHANDLAHVRSGDIAVVALADPQWLGAFDRAVGLVTEVGGWLAHLAILAREKELPAVFGVAQAMQHLQTGDVVSLGSDGSVRVLERAQQTPASAMP